MLGNFVFGFYFLFHIMTNTTRHSLDASGLRRVPRSFFSWIFPERERESQREKGFKKVQLHRCMYVYTLHLSVQNVIQVNSFQMSILRFHPTCIRYTAQCIRSLMAVWPSVFANLSCMKYSRRFHNGRLLVCMCVCALVVTSSGCTGPIHNDEALP